MSVLERIKALFDGAKKNVLKNISEEEVLDNGKENSSPKKTSKSSSSKDGKLDDVVSGTKTSESFTKKSKTTNTKKPEVKKIKVEKTDDKKPKVTSKTDNFSNLGKVSKNENVSNLKENSNNEELSSNDKILEKEEEVDSTEEKVSVDEVSQEKSSENNKKSDNMTLLNDTELLTNEDIDKEFTQEFIDAGIDTVEHCFQCGTCGGGCPSGKRTPYKVRQIVRKCLLGLKEEVITDDSLWMCTTCYTCQERCPRSVKIVDIVKKARNIAAHAGYMAKPHKMTGLFVITTGHGVPINPATKELRKRVGLGELPPTTHAYPEALKEVQTICEKTGFDALIGFDKETGELKE
jgi:heterodisulfide reductase subunit C